MANIQTTASFEREKNLKAGGITLLISLVLLLCFIWIIIPTIQVVPKPAYAPIEVILDSHLPVPVVPVNDNSGDGSQASSSVGTAADNSAPPNNVPDKAAATPSTAPKTNPPALHGAGSNTSGNKNPAKENSPKAVFTGSKGTSTNNSDNNDDFNKYNDKLGGNGNGNGTSTGNGEGSGTHAGHGAGSGVSIGSGLKGRRIKMYPTFQDDFNENAKVIVDITVNKLGKVIGAEINPRGTTTSNATIRAIAKRKAYELTFNAGNEDEQTGSVNFSFKVNSN